MIATGKLINCVKRERGFLVLLLVLVIQLVPSSYFVSTVFAAEATVDSAVGTNANDHLFSGFQTVFIDDQVGYKFYVDSTERCVYSKTTDGGTTWGTAVTFDAQTDCFGVSVWYDQWTPGDTTGTFIHLLTIDANPDELWYNRLNTSNDTLLVATSISGAVNSGQGGTFVSGGNTASIVKGTDGTIYMGIADNGDAYVVECSASCNLTTSWTETGTNPMDQQPDYIQLVPLLGGDILLIQRDTSADIMRSKVWNNTAGTWDANWATIDASTAESTTYDQNFNAVLNANTGDVFLVYTDLVGPQGNPGGNDDDIRTAIYSGGSWSATSDVVTNSAQGITDVSMAIDANNGTVYVTYTAQTTPGTANTANVYWATSTAAMTTWGAQQGPLNIGSDDIYGIGMNGYDNERILATWYEPAINDILSNTVADISPATIVSATGTQATQVRVGTSNFYIGGKFILEEKLASRNVTSVTITETGSIDAANDISNVKLFYDLDTSAPYNCLSESYTGIESQYGTTDTDGFSATNGSSTFTAAGIAISPTQALCLYPVMDIDSTATSGNTIDIEISDPVTQLLVSGGVEVQPTDPLVLNGSTTVVRPFSIQTHYHWRNDDNTETLATSKTGGVQDTPLSSLQKNIAARLRFGISNKGSTTTVPTSFRLEWANNPGTCSSATGWVDVGASADEWDMFNSTHITDGTNATNISVAIGGVDNENTVFLSSNGGLRDTSSQTGSLILSPTNWTELEFSIIPTASTVEGNSYCFRLTNAGTPLEGYNNYPSVTVASDVTVTAIGTQTAQVLIPATNQYAGGAFVLTDGTAGAANVTSVTVTGAGTVDLLNDITNIKLRYDLDTTAPYDCTSESYAASDTQYGSTVANFNGSYKATFTGSVSNSPTQTVCLYLEYDVAATASNGETLELLINDPSTEIVVTGSSVSPNIPIAISGTTVFANPVTTQAYYHWRNNDGLEADATSATGGTENTTLANTSKTITYRLRLAIGNTGLSTAPNQQFRLEWAQKITTCSNATVWTRIDSAGDEWEIAPTANLTDGGNTTDVLVANGGVSNPAGTFLSANGGVKDANDTTASVSVPANNYLDLEYSIRATTASVQGATYCFRVTNAGTPLNSYSVYPQATIKLDTDYKIQRGVSTITGTSLTITAGVDYDAPAAASRAFIRITNTQLTGAGPNTGNSNNNADDVTAYILNPGNITTSVTFQRPAAAINNTRVAWEIVEYIGVSGGENEMIVRRQEAVAHTAAGTTVNGTVTNTVANNSKVAVFITGQSNEDAGRNAYNIGLSTAAWNTTNNQAVFTRGGAGSVSNVSYALVEFVGANWAVQRVSHTYSAVGTAQTQPITAVNSLARTFLHVQKRTAQSNHADIGHTVWLSGIGQVSFLLDAAASTPANHTSVAWVIENKQTLGATMKVTRSNGSLPTAGTGPEINNISIGKTIDDLSITSLFVNNRSDEASRSFPEPYLGARIISATQYELWRSDSSSNVSYRTEVVEWPTAARKLEQNYYRLYVDNNALLPTDPWPAGATDLGENTEMTADDVPLAIGNTIRIRMTLSVTASAMPAGLDALKLQYAKRVTTCTAVSTWSNLGEIGSTTAPWRGVNNTPVEGTVLSIDPPTPGDLLISIATVAGTYEEQNNTSLNPYTAFPGDELEYDWVIQHNGADDKSSYCFRMTEADGTQLNAYNFYPVIRTVGFEPRLKTWRWYDDETNLTPSTPLSGAAENVAPVDVQNQNIVKLRLTLRESSGAAGVNNKFVVQYSEYADFSQNVATATSISACTETSIWCYADGAGTDNSLIDAAVISDADSCVSGIGAGCGTHNEGTSTVTATFDQAQFTTAEYEFTLKHAGARANAVYYFRLYDLVENEVVPLDTVATYPSLVTEGAQLVFTVGGVNTGTNIAGITTDTTTSPTSIGFGLLPFGTSIEAAQQLTIDTNATEGYQILMYATQQLLNSYGDTIDPITSSNASPAGWSTACGLVAVGCFGYHTTDATLEGGSSRFAPIDSYAAISTSPVEIMYSSIPIVDVHNVIYRVMVSEQQVAGDYQTNIVYIATPVF